MKLAIAFLLPCLALQSCRKADDTQSASSVPEPVEKLLRSEQLAGNFPLFPLIEKQLWQDLIVAEKIINDPQASDKQQSGATAKIKTISDQLEKKHPFEETESDIRLGGITYFKSSRRIEIPAEVNYPNADDTRHPEELELILCSEKGRVHETLFITKTRPLHLELLMHLAGFEKTPTKSLFQVSVTRPDQEPIPIENFISAVDGDELPKQMIWEFSGGDFQDFYSPDQTGDFLILWHAHSSVLRIRHGKIASGEIKLKAKELSSFPQGTGVKILLEPVEKAGR